MKIPLSRAVWARNTNLGNGKYDNSCKAGPDVKLWYLGHGVLVEIPGKLDCLVPSANVVSVEALAGAEWGEEKPVEDHGRITPQGYIPPAGKPAGISSVAAMEMRGEVSPGSTEIDITNRFPLGPAQAAGARAQEKHAAEHAASEKKRGPGWGKKGEGA